MKTAIPQEDIDHNRRRFLGAAAITVASAHLGIFQLCKRRIHET
jgi:hypothetical protein